MPVKDITGQRFGRVTVLKGNKARNPWGQMRWDCICNCGTKRTVVMGHFIRASVDRAAVNREVPSKRFLNTVMVFEKPFAHLSSLGRNVYEMLRKK